MLVTGYFFALSFKEYGEAFIKDEGFITIAGATASIFAGIRFQWGPLVEKLGFKAVYGTMLAL